MKNLKVIFMGTPEFSTNVLKNLIQNTNVIGVVCQPDKIVGRKKEIIFSPIKQLAIENNIKVFQPNNIKIEYKEILDLKPDMIITCAYGQIIPNEILNYPKYGCINVHASLLPKLRGGAPIHHAIIDGYQETGITIMYMNQGMDSGDIISQREIPITDDDTYETLHDKLSILGSELLIETIKDIILGNSKKIKQNETEITYGYNIKREEELIDFNKNLNDIYNQIRGLSPVPGSYFLLNNKTIKVYKAYKIIDNSYNLKENGEIVKFDKTGLYIKVDSGLIKITDIKMEGKKRMTIENFYNGNKQDFVGLIANKN